MSDNADATRHDYSRYSGLGLSLSDGIMTVTLSNPGRKNAITTLQGDELVTIWEDLWEDPDVRVIILTGDGGDFCSGADVSGLVRRAEQPGDPDVRVKPVNPTFRKARKHVYGILECEKPIIAKVRGVAYGLGVNLALACDMVFAAPGARFCDSHVKAGLVAGDGGVLLWPLLVGMHRAKEYLMTGEPVLAEKAADIGLINGCIPDDQLDAHVQALAERLRDLPPHAVNYTKAALNVAMRQMTGAAFEMSLGYEIYTMRTNDFREATQAMIGKRKGQFRGD
ncbi:enoyl-CoA hydratase [Novosphingobium sp. CF614]|uniref:enoyl-CoA hydratase/isomerase family protein n=1 Tax=Novosphingobium sp. CF614 TaxID=1884364 RepID=UPI0008E1DFF8|nr:enoyl-CoA hydratase-related protein [Novosphingobium sp. CF614]SFF77604.1 enoyl-CoA hydratase [Novosphingobium sp. CF614]